MAVFSPWGTFFNIALTALVLGLGIGLFSSLRYWREYRRNKKAP